MQNLYLPQRSAYSAQHHGGERTWGLLPKAQSGATLELDPSVPAKSSDKTAAPPPSWSQPNGRPWAS